MVMVFLKS